MEKKYRHTELNNEELKKLFTSGSMPISYHNLAGNTEKAEEARKEYESNKSEQENYSMSRLFLTGDTHGDHDWSKLNTKNFPEQKELNKDDYLVVLGDFGAVWSLDKTDKYLLSNYCKRNFTTLFIDGNHENHDALDALPVAVWNGGKVHKVADSVYHLMRGQVFELCGKTLFTMGGAESSDKEYRKPGISWWSRELPSTEECEEAVANLAKHGGKVDYVLTHCAPEAMLCAQNMPGVEMRFQNGLTSFLDTLAQTVDFKGWYFGHYHEDSDLGKYHLLFNRVVELGD